MHRELFLYCSTKNFWQLLCYNYVQPIDVIAKFLFGTFLRVTGLNREKQRSFSANLSPWPPPSTTQLLQPFPTHSLPLKMLFKKRQNSDHSFRISKMFSSLKLLCFFVIQATSFFQYGSWNSQQYLLKIDNNLSTKFASGSNFFLHFLLQYFKLRFFFSFFTSHCMK